MPIELFTVDDGVHGRELWRTDGTATGTFLVKDILPGSVGSGLGSLTKVGSQFSRPRTNSSGRFSFG
ncbi:MAG: ELWxxDGT repeat protein [Microvirga sp.]|jgi:ELWxxDGT repeat protein